MDKAMNLQHKLDYLASRQTNDDSSRGFVLPTLIVLSVVLMAMGMVVLQYIAASTSVVQGSYYSNIAKSAADAGAVQALSCIKNNEMGWTNTAKLMPNRNCSGGNIAGASSVLTSSSDGSWRATFEVNELADAPEGMVVTSIGKVEFFYAGSSTPTQTFEANTKVNIPTTDQDDVRPIAQGLAVTKTSAGSNFNCSIANMSLYCWGNKQFGQTGTDVNATSQITPLLTSTGALAGKRIYDIETGAYNGCALADGRLYCWGPNTIGQLGNGSPIGSIQQPSAVGGDIASRYVQKISIGTADVFSDAQYMCGITGQKTYCWGGNNYGQIGQVNYTTGPCNIIFFPPCPNYTGVETKARYTSGPPWNVNATAYYPVEVFGYGSRPYESQSQVYNKPFTEIDAGAYGACGITNGRNFCWGDRFILTNIWPFDGNGSTTSSNGWKNGTLNGQNATSVLNGESTACAIANGAGHCWGGRSGNGQNLIGSDTPRLVPNGSGAPLYGVSMIDGNTNDDLGPICMRGNGNAYCWGGNAPSGLTVGNLATGEDAVTEVTGGRDHGCIVANGSNYCFGDGSSGALGNGNTTAQSVPVKSVNIGLTSGEAATQISAGREHNCAVINGYIYCWGKNTQGQLGLGDRVNRTQPHGIDNITEPRGATEVSAGGDHSCGIINGNAYCWGDNTYGQLGNGNTNDVLDPVQVGGLLTGKAVTSIAAGETHTCAVADSTAYCWGRNARGQLGNNSTSTSTVPVAVQGMSGRSIKSITAGDQFSCALADLDAYCWGDNTYGQIGRSAAPNVGGQQLTAIAVNAASTAAFSQISAGKDFTCAVIDGYTHCWGNNATGQLGRSSTTANQWQTLRVNAPVDGRHTIGLSTGASHACSITDGIAYCWGDNANGKLGNGNASQSNSPAAVVATPAFLGTNYPYQISAGGTSSCAIANGKITCWGSGSEGQLGVTGNGAPRLTATEWTSEYIRQQRVLDLPNAVVF